MRKIEPDWNVLLANLIVSSWKIALVITGGGTRVIEKCFRRAGASKNFVEAVVPYSHAAMIAYLGGQPVASSASPETAQQLAEVAYGRANRLGDEVQSQPAVGIALVAALPTEPPRRGEDRIHIVLQTEQRQVVWSANLTKGQHDRDSAEKVAETMAWQALHELVTGHDELPDLPGVDIRRTTIDL